MHTPWMFITGVSIIGFFFLDVLFAFSPRNPEAPLLMQIACAIAFGLIAASFV